MRPVDREQGGLALQAGHYSVGRRRLRAVRIGDLPLGFRSHLPPSKMEDLRMMLHRFALTITRKQPYADWANSDEPDPVPYMDELPRTVYLAPAIDSLTTITDLLDEFWPDIFEEELAAWNEDEASWPVQRTRELFDHWFDAELTDTVVDLIPEEPLTASDLEHAVVADALQHCAWCDLELEPNEGRNVALRVPERERLASREGLSLTLFVDEEQALAGIFTTRDSPAAAAGEDLIFRACSSRCEKLIRKEAQRALRLLLKRLPVQ